MVFLLNSIIPFASSIIKIEIRPQILNEGNWPRFNLDHRTGYMFKDYYYYSSMIKKGILNEKKEDISGHIGDQFSICR